MRTRRTWDETWMAVADDVSMRSGCVRTYACVLVTPDNAVVSTGYNGPPAGLTVPLVEHVAVPDVDYDCERDCPLSTGTAAPGDYSHCPAVHAEANALIHADRSRLAGGTAYVNGLSCWDCAKLLANAGLARVVYRYRTSERRRDPDRTRSILERSGVTVVMHEVPDQEDA